MQGPRGVALDSHPMWCRGEDARGEAAETGASGSSDGWLTMMGLQ